MSFAWTKNIFKPGKRHNWPNRELAGALELLARRVTLRYWMESTRLALLWGLAVAIAVLVLLRLYPVVSPVVAAIAGMVAALVVVALRIYRRPDALAVVRVADDLGMNGEAVTAFRLLENSAADPWSRAAVDRGTSAGAKFARGAQMAYPVVSRWRPWRDLVLLAAALVVLQVIPDPLGSYWTERRAEKQVLQAVAEETSRALDRVRNLQVGGKDVLPEEVKQKLADLPRDVARAGDRREAAAKLEQARWELDGARAVVDPSARRDIQRLAEAWGSINSEKWRNMAEALRGGDEQDIQKAVENLSGKMNDGGKEEKLELAANMFTGAGMVESPDLRQALRDTAVAALNSGRSSGSSGSGSSGQGGRNMNAAANSLSGALSSAAATASAGGALSSASSTLTALARDLSGTGSAGGTQVAGNNSSTGNAGIGNSTGSPAETAPGNAGSGNAHGPGETCSGDDGGGAPGGSGNSGNSGSNGNNNSGNSSGGTQGSGGNGASSSGSGLNMIYTPFHPDGGVESQVQGQLREGEQGSQVGLENSPTALGAVRPYTEVYGRYMAEAQESLGRAPLPPDREKLVWHYFNALNE